MGSYLRLAVVAICVAIVASQPLVGDETEAPATQTAAPTEAPTPAPTPAPECKKGDRKANLENCKAFFECDKNGVWKADSCFWFRKFDAEKLKCESWGARCASAPTPAPTPAPAN